MISTCNSIPIGQAETRQKDVREMEIRSDGQHIDEKYIAAGAAADSHLELDHSKRFFDSKEEIARRFELSFMEYGLDKLPQYEKLNQRLSQLSDAVSEKELKEKLVRQSRTEAEKVRLFVEQAVSEVEKVAQQQLCDAAKRLEAAEIALATQTKRLRCKHEEVIMRNPNHGNDKKATQAVRKK
ncbi:unnamed protein product [Dibothriocephalus latus]|uniref:Uncharacterized protein n=1 Tax=Dibothriocephalus latus TaxID=60516 RepID=A0A3P6TD75_DIBLA|nr:unnamed protein product [Dibothriocephalus latus]